MASSTLLVYEFFTGGGCLGKDIPADLAIEGLGMLWSLLADLRHWGEIRTLTAMDTRVEGRIPGLNRTTIPADRVIPVSDTGLQHSFGELLELCDVALIIAPETDGILAALSAQAEKADIPILGSCSSAVSIAGNKALCYDAFQRGHLPFPSTKCISFDCAEDELRRMSLPMVVKPIDGAGSDGVYCVRCESDIETALKYVRDATLHRQFLIQPFIEGRPISVSVLAAQDRCLPISLNEQLVETGAQLKYTGSRVPYICPNAQTILELACSAVESIRGLRGYVGVDLVLQDDSAQLIEINPRMTTSYIGLRQVSRVNLAEAMWNACMLGILPAKIQISGQAVMRKNDFNTWGLSKWLT